MGKKGKQAGGGGAAPAPKPTLSSLMISYETLFGGDAAAGGGGAGDALEQKLLSSIARDVAAPAPLAVQKAKPEVEASSGKKRKQEHMPGAAGQHGAAKQSQHAAQGPKQKDQGGQQKRKDQQQKQQQKGQRHVKQQWHVDDEDEAAEMAAQERPGKKQKTKPQQASLPASQKQQPQQHFKQQHERGIKQAPGPAAGFKVGIGSQSTGHGVKVKQGSWAADKAGPGAGTAAETGMQKKKAGSGPLSWPFETDYADHFETSSEVGAGARRHELCSRLSGHAPHRLSCGRHTTADLL